MMSIKTTLFACFLIVIVHFKCIANNTFNATNYNFEKITSNNILSNQKVNCIYKDKQGFIWIGTTYGLFKYNGSDVEVYRNQKNDSTSIAFNDIGSIFEDANYSLWVLGNDEQLYCKYNIEFDNFTQCKADINSAIYPFPIPIHKINSKYLCTTGSIFKYNVLNKRYEKIRLNSNADTLAITSYIEDDEGKLWIGSFTRGLLKYNEHNNRLIPYYASAVRENNVRISSLFYDSHKNIWVGGMREELNVFDPRKEIFVKKLTNNNTPNLNFTISSFCEDGKGNIWMATNNGVSIFNIKSQQFTFLRNELLNPLSLSTNSITTLYNDNLGNIWIGTFDGGVNIYNANCKKFNGIKAINFSNNKLNRSFKSIFKDKNNVLWVGTDFGLNKIDPSGEIIKTYITGLNTSNFIGKGGVCAVHEDKLGRLWLGTWGGGLSCFNPKSEVAKNFNEVDINNNHLIGDRNILCIEEDNEGLFWIGTVLGIVDVLNPLNNTFEHIDLKCEYIRSILDDPQNNAVWCCTSNGLVKINKTNRKITHYLVGEPENNSISYNYTTNIVKDNSGNLWITTLNGLNKFDVKNNKFYKYFNINNIELANLYGLQIDKNNNLWFGCNSYLLKYNIQTQKLWYYNEYDGLIVNIKYSYKLNTGEFVFGGSDGVNVFYPDSIKSNEQIPKVIFTDFKVQNKSIKWQDKTVLNKVVSATKSINLTYKDYVFGFDFSALSYISPQKCWFAYKLEGFDRDWNYIGDKTNVTFTSIPAGDYIFKVKASNNEGYWNSNETSIVLHISPPFWGTIWFKTLFIIGIIIIVLIWLRYKTYAINRRNQRLERVVKIRTTHLHDANAELEAQKEEIERISTMVHDADQKRIRFFINISHEFRTPLTLIINPIEKLLSMSHSNNQAKPILQVIAQNAQSLLNLVNQVLDIRKLETNNMQLEVAEHNLDIFLRNIYESFSHLAASQSIKYTINSNLSTNKAWFDAPKIERVLINLLSNAFKFTSPNGSIELNAQLNAHDENVKIAVFDSGIGIANDKLQLIFDNYYQEKNEKYGLVYGTGIGLNLAKELIELHHGTIQVTSVLEQGSCFSIHFPIHENSYAPTEFSIVKTQQQLKIDTMQLGNLEAKIDEQQMAPNNAPLVLIVEDNSQLRWFIKQNFLSTYQIIEAANGKDGYELACKHLPDIIISDIMMPQMNGFELCHKIKTNINVSHIPVILLTAIAEEASELKGLGLGADDYLPKPFSMKVLLAKIENVIETRKQLRKKYSQNWILNPAEITVMSVDEQFLTKCMTEIEKNIDNELFGVQQLADNIGMSRVNLLNKFKKLTEQSPSEFILSVRLKRAAELIKQNHANISEIAYMVGFQAPSAFNKAFKKQFGCTPSQYK